jgi:hypothetical protein
MHIHETELNTDRNNRNRLRKLLQLIRCH